MGRKFGTAAAALALATALGTGAAVAHHGWSHYDGDTPLTLEGQIREVGFEHPHATLRIEAEDGRTWLVILAPPTRMIRYGLTDAELQPGMTVTVTGYPHRSEPEEMRAERITVNGRTQGLRR